GAGGCVRLGKRPVAAAAEGVVPVLAQKLDRLGRLVDGRRRVTRAREHERTLDVEPGAVLESTLGTDECLCLVEVVAGEVEVAVCSRDLRGKQVCAAEMRRVL